MSAAARDAILGRIRAAQSTARLPAPRVVPTPPRVVLDPPARLERFRAELQALGVESFVEATPVAVRTRVAALVDGLRLLSWDAAALPYELGTLATNAVTGSASRDEQARAEIGLTGCDAAIAETGSIVLLSTAGRSRAISLLPPVHVVVVPVPRLRSNMAEVFEELGPAMDAAASCTVVTGPSRTADIELTLTLGVHGPGKVVVVIGP